MYEDCKKVRPLWVMLPKMSAHRRDFDEFKYVFFYKKWWIAGKVLGTWDNVSNVIEKWFDSEPVYKHRYLKTKIRSCEGKKHKFSWRLGAKRRFSIHLPIDKSDWFCFYNR